VSDPEEETAATGNAAAQLVSDSGQARNNDAEDQRQPLLDVVNPSIPTPFIDEKGVYRIPYERLRLLLDSTDVRQLSQDATLLTTFHQIDSAERGAGRLLDRALKQDPKVGAALNLMLQVIGIRNAQGESLI